MKRVLGLLLVITLLSGLFVMPVSSAENIYKEFYVDGARGNDSNSGTQASPFKSIQKAQKAARAVTSNMSGDIVINIASGRYEIKEMLVFDNSDSGLNGHKVIYRGDKNHKPVLSGGIEVSGFTEMDNGIWKASVDVPFIRDLSVNGVMADIAASENKIFGTGHYYEDNTDTIPDGIYVHKADMGLFNNPQDIELKWDIAHTDAIVHVKDLVQDPKDENQVIVKLPNPFWSSVYNRNTTYYSGPLAPGWEIAFSVRNAFEHLDEPGEFYYNKGEKTLYYMPRDGEDMATAEVICPVNDKIMVVRGRGPRNLITNLSFENIKFAHTTWADLDEHSVFYNQAEAPMTTFSSGNITPGAIEASWIKGLSVTECDFYGLATVALRLYEGVTNSTIKGNTFADIGHGAIVVGLPQHTKDDEPSTATGAANVFFRKGWTTAVQPNSTKTRPFLINSNVSDQDYYSSYVWTNADELKENPNAKSYIRADLGKPYDISSITLDFNNQSLTASGVTYSHKYSSEDMSNFEILVSNDRYFNTYKVVKTYATNTERRPTIYETFNEKFRYVMVRKTKAEPFAMTFMRIYSKDEDRVGNKESGLCKNIEISNNYITRIAQFHTGSPGITAYYTENVTIDHNVITDVPYSGLNLGWGWDAVFPTPKNNTISNNYIDNYMLQGLDGGGIYVHGTNPGTKIKGNYITDGHNGYGAIYTDGGSVGFDISNNVIDNANAAVFIGGGSIKNITGSNNYGATGLAEPFKGTVKPGQDGYAAYPVIENKGQNCTIQEGISMLPNSYLEDAAKIAFNAGLTDDYKHILDNVPQKDDVYYDGVYAYYSKGRKSEMRYANYTNSYKRIHYYDGYLNNILVNGTFGNEPWQYTPELKFQIEELHERTRQMYNKKVEPTAGVSGWFRGGHIDELYMSEYLVDNVVKTVKHLTFEEMVEICEERIANCVEGGAFDKYQKGAKDQLQAALNDAENMPSATDADEYLRVVYLEKAVNEFDNKKYTDEIIYAYLPYGKTKIDRENKAITITLPKGINVSSAKPKFITYGESVVSYDGTFQNNVPKKLSVENYYVYNPSTQWTLTVKNEDFSNADNGICAIGDTWYNSNDNTSFKERNGSLAFQPYVYPYMYKKPVKGEINFTVKAERPDTQDGIHFIISSASGADLEYDGKGYAKNTYYKLSLIGQELKVYKVVSGNPQEVAAEDVDFTYGEYTDVSILNERVDGAELLTVKIAGETIFDKEEIGNIGADGYFGILTKSVKVEIMTNDRTYWDLSLSNDMKSINLQGNIDDTDIGTDLVYAFYDENGCLIHIATEKVAKNSYTVPLPDNTKKVSVLQFEDLDKLIPVRRKSELIIK